MKISTYHKSERGYSHILKNTVCQDYSLVHTDPDHSFFVALVSDGHGNETYFRSDKGSKFACEVAMEAIKQMVDLYPKIEGKSAQVPVRRMDKKNLKDEDAQKIPQFGEVISSISDIDEIFEHLFQHIFFQWKKKVEEDWVENPPTEEETLLLGSNEIVKAYGATLIAFVRTARYWFGFQLGDGKCLTCNEDGEWTDPFLNDPACFQNLTTSLCQTDAYKSFRYSFSGKGDFPFAVMLGTDGIDDSWGDRLSAFYTSILDDIVKVGLEKAKKGVADCLPGLSKSGSKDDVSIAWIIDEDKIAENLPKIVLLEKDKEIINLNDKLKRTDSLLIHMKQEQKADRDKYEEEIKLLNKQIIDKNEQYKRDIDRYSTKIKDAEKEHSKLKKLNDNLEKELRNVKREYEVYKKECEKYKLEVDNLKEKLQKAEKKCKTLEVTEKELREELKATKKQLERLQGTQDDHSGNIGGDEVDDNENKMAIEVEEKNSDTPIGEKIKYVLVGCLLGVVLTFSYSKVSASSEENGGSTPTEQTTDPVKQSTNKTDTLGNDADLSLL